MVLATAMLEAMDAFLLIFDEISAPKFIYKYKYKMVIFTQHYSLVAGWKPHFKK